MTESASRWFVGSSSSSVCASLNRILASSILLRCPPDRVRSGWCSTRSGSPRLAARLPPPAPPGGPPAPGGEARRLRLRGVAAEHGEPVAEVAVAADGPLGVIRIRHLRLGLA